MKILTILAPGRCLLQDIAKYGIVGDVMAVSGVIADYTGTIKYAVGMWEEYIKALINLRKIRNRNVDNVDIRTRPIFGNIPINNSGLLALSLARSFGYDCIRVLGMPVDGSGHYYDIDDCGEKALPYRFLFELKEAWEEEFKTWDNVFVASGNLLKYFKQLQPLVTEVPHGLQEER